MPQTVWSGSSENTPRTNVERSDLRCSRIVAAMSRDIVQGLSSARAAGASVSGSLTRQRWIDIVPGRRGVSLSAIDVISALCPEIAAPSGWRDLRLIDRRHNRRVRASSHDS